MRFLLDTNILIPLEDSNVVLGKSFAGFVRLAMQHGHSLFYHPASKKDIARDVNEERRQRTLERLSKYIELPNPPLCIWNESVVNENDAVDNEILYAIKRDAVHALVTEDHGIHAKAKSYNLGHRVYYIQTAEAWLNQLHSEHPVVLPNISEVELYLLDVNLGFFDSLRDSYRGFNDWFSRSLSDFSLINPKEPWAKIFFSSKDNRFPLSKKQLAHVIKKRPKNKNNSLIFKN